VIGPDERYRISELIERLNDLGFTVDEVDLIPSEGGSQLRIRPRVAGRSYHAERLRELTGIDALDNQARQILSDLVYYQAQVPSGTSSGKSLAAVRWRVSQFEPMLLQLAATEGVRDPVQAYCDLLHHRYLESAAAGFDVGTDRAYETWIEQGRPGFEA